MTYTRRNINTKEAHSLRQMLEKDGYCIVPCLVDKDLINRLAGMYIPQLRDARTSLGVARGSIYPGTMNYIGRTRSSYWSLERKFWFPWNEVEGNDIDIVSLSHELSSIRDMICARKTPLQIDSSLSFSYTSLSRYPSQHGFIKRHCDATNGMSVIHFKLDLARSEGSPGFHLWDNAGRRVDFLSRSSLGDLIIFNGRNEHAVYPPSSNDARFDRLALFQVPSAIPKEYMRSIYRQEEGSLYYKLRYKFITASMRKVLRVAQSLSKVSNT